MKLSVCLAVKNEQDNLARCLDSIKDIADEIIIFDEHSTDDSVKIAKNYGAKVTEFAHKNNFHETKQAAIKAAEGEWILQLDADEVVSKLLSNEIKEVISLDNKTLVRRRIANVYKQKLFMRHQRAIESRDGKIGKRTGEVVAFFIPRKNYFLGKPLTYAGVYPDAVIRLFRNGKAYLPARSVHEQMVVKGEVAWLEYDLEHHDSPTLRRYLARLNRYTDLQAADFTKQKVSKNIFTLLWFTTIKPTTVFLKLYLRHKGFKDGMRGFLWSVLSALHFPIAYFKHWTNQSTIN